MTVMDGRAMSQPARRLWRISSRCRPGESRVLSAGTALGTAAPGRRMMMETEDINQEKLSWIIEHVDEMFLDLEMYDHET
jgi:hypothetical protein